MKQRIYILLLLILIPLQMEAQKVGLVLSGGGAKGLTHIGIIRALEENEIPIDYITGTSMGAIVGSLTLWGILLMKWNNYSNQMTLNAGIREMLKKNISTISRKIRRLRSLSTFVFH